MPDPKAQTKTQLANIEAASGMTLVGFALAVTDLGLEKHGAIVAFLKADHALTYGNANLIAHLVRERLAGGPPAEELLLDAQYSKGKAKLRPIYERLAEIALGCGNDVEQVVQKTGVSFRRSMQFALVQAPSAKRIQLGLNLDETPAGDRVEPTKGMCTHRAILTGVEDVDGDVAAWIEAAYKRAR